MSHVSQEELSSSTVQHFGLSRRLKRCTVVPPCGSGLVKCCTVVLQYGLGRLKCCTVVPTCGLGRLQCCTVVPKCGWGRLKCCTFVAKFPDMLCVEGFYVVIELFPLVAVGRPGCAHEVRQLMRATRPCREKKNKKG